MGSKTTLEPIWPALTSQNGVPLPVSLCSMYTRKRSRSFEIFKNGKTKKAGEMKKEWSLGRERERVPPHTLVRDLVEWTALGHSFCSLLRIRHSLTLLRVFIRCTSLLFVLTNKFVGIWGRGAAWIAVIRQLWRGARSRGQLFLSEIGNQTSYCSRKAGD